MNFTLQTFNSTIYDRSLICAKKEHILDFCQDLNFSNAYSGSLIIAVSLLSLLIILGFEHFKIFSEEDSWSYSKALLKFSIYLHIGYFIIIFFFSK